MQHTRSVLHLTPDTTADRLAGEEDQPPVDGRTARGQRTRSKVVDALLALQEEGDLAPTAQRVAQRAGVALRTVFGHFSDMETLWAEGGQRHLAKLAALSEPIDPALSREERVERFCRSRARVLEALLPVMRAARLREPTSPQLQRNREVYIEAGDTEVAEVFAPELARLSPTDRERCLHALYLAGAGPAWEALRHDRGLSPQEAGDVLRHAVQAVLPS
jgi:TetR/AcrR family transcriptional regulator of autoinduction and epiphytic fitness